jgi:hypothetical protein
MLGVPRVPYGIDMRTDQRCAESEGGDSLRRLGRCSPAEVWTCFVVG